MKLPPSEAVPFHYRANGDPCRWSGTAGWTEGQTCPAGCEGARTHYANDGHVSCAEGPK